MTVKLTKSRRGRRTADQNSHLNRVCLHANSNINIREWHQVPDGLLFSALSFVSRAISPPHIPRRVTISGDGHTLDLRAACLSHMGAQFPFIM